jgi:hypothetical protein
MRLRVGAACPQAWGWQSWQLASMQASARGRGGAETHQQIKGRQAAHVSHALHMQREVSDKLGHLLCRAVAATHIKRWRVG